MYIYDISDMTGVSIATVSRVLNRTPSVLPDTAGRSASHHKVSGLYIPALFNVMVSI